MSPDPREPLPCWIYRSPKKDEMYLYLAQEGAFDRVPEPLLRLFGTPVFVMRLDLHGGRPLAREDVHQVMEGLRARGFHLQMPPQPVPQRLDG